MEDATYGGTLQNQQHGIPIKHDENHEGETMNTQQKPGLIRDIKANIDIGAGIGIGLLFAGLMIVGFIIYLMKDQLIAVAPNTQAVNSITNISTGWNNTINMFIVVIIIGLIILGGVAILSLHRRNNQDDSYY